jgi:O-antigen ligase
LTVVPLLVLPVATLLTGSRNALLQLMLLAVLILLDQRRGSPVQRARAFAAIVTMVVVVLIATPTEMMLRASNFDTTGGPTTIDRLNTYRAGLIMVVEHPIFGVGPGNFMWRNEALTGRGTSPHNSYLWAITSGGPLLLLLYLALFWKTYQMLRAVERAGSRRFVWLATALRFNLLTFLVASLFATIWLQEPFWLLVGLTIILARVAGVRRPGAALPLPVPATVATR